MNINFKAHLIAMNPCDYPELFQRVTCKPMPHWLRSESELYTYAKDCYRNVFRMMHIPESKYVACMGASVIYLSHAIIEIDGEYYDPTWELYSDIGNHYWIYKVFDIGELLNLVDERPDASLPSTEELIFNDLQAGRINVTIAHPDITFDDE